MVTCRVSLSLRDSSDDLAILVSQKIRGHKHATMHTRTHTHTKGQFRVPSLPHFNVFGIWEKAGAPGDKIQVQYFFNVELKKTCLRDSFKD